MHTPEGRERMLKRHEIVVRIIDANSRNLRLENEFNGLDIERRNAERLLDEGASSVDARETLADIEERMQTIERERAKLAAEKVWLDAALADFDAPQPAGPDSGQT